MTRMSESLMPQVNGGGGGQERLDWSYHFIGRQWVEITMTVAVENLRLDAQVLDRKTKRIKFNSNGISRVKERMEIRFLMSGSNENVV